MRKIAVFTGTRADYGLLRLLALAIEKSQEANLALIVSGSHLSGPQGTSSGEIVRDGLEFAATVPIWSGDDSRAGAAREVGEAIPRYHDALAEIGPDVLVVLGDRLEAFAVATAATIAGVPIAHIHGGEITEGAMDDALRHAITKMSLIHFASTEEHRRRIIQLGEHPDRVHFIGAPIVDAVAALRLPSRAEIEEQFGVHLDAPTALVTYHPAAMDVAPPLELLDELLGGLMDVDELRVIITGSNTDIGNRAVRERIAEWVASHRERVDYVESFGQLGYLGAMSHAAVVAGNSSSVVLEAPVLGTPSILIGDRQQGRPLANSVRVPSPKRAAIATSLAEALLDESRVAEAALFGTPGFADRALRILLDADRLQPPRKAFYDL